MHKPAALCHIIPRLARQKGFHKHSAEDMGLFTEAVNKAKIAKGLGGQGGGYVTGQWKKKKPNFVRSASIAEESANTHHTQLQQFHS